VIFLVGDNRRNEGICGLFLCFWTFCTETQWVHAFWGPLIVKSRRAILGDKMSTFLFMEISSPKFVGTLTMTCILIETMKVRVFNAHGPTQHGVNAELVGDHVGHCVHTIVALQRLCSLTS
jgi:hypothetical protein